MSTEVASLFATLSLKDNLTAGLNQAKGGLDSFATSLGNIGTKMTAVGQAGQRMMQPIIGAMESSVFAAMDFNEAMTNTNSILMLSETEFNALSDAVLDMGRNAIAGPQAVANAMYDIASGVMDASTHMDILSTSIAVSEAGSADLAGTTRALISVMNSYKFSAKQAAFAGDVMTRTVGMGVLTMDELAASIGSVTPVANMMGIAFNDLGSYIAYMTTQGASAGEATTQLNAMMSALLTPTDAMTDALLDLGFANGQAAVDALGLAGTYEALNAALGIDGLAEATGRWEAFRGALQLTGDGAEEFFNTFNSGSLATGTAQLEQVKISAGGIQDALGVAENHVGDLGRGLGALAGIPTEGLNSLNEAAVGVGGAFQGSGKEVETFTDKARDIQRASPAAQFALLKSEVSALAIELGTALLPPLMQVFNYIKPIVQDVAEWVKKNPELVAALGIGAAAMFALFSIMVPLGIAFSALGAIVTGFGVAFAIATSPITIWVIAAIALVGLLAYAWFTNFGGIRDKTTEWYNAIKPHFDEISTVILLLTFLPLGLYRAWDTNFMGIRTVVENAVTGAKDAMNSLRDRVNTWWDSMSSGLTNWKNNFSSGINGALQPLRDLIDLINEAINKINDLPGAALDFVGLGGAEAEGGMVSAGTPYLVGEEGPEIFTPSSAGNIIPNGRTRGILAGGGGGSGGGMIIQNINVYGVQNAQELYDELVEIERGRWGGLPKI